MLTPTSRANRMSTLLTAAILTAGTSVCFAQGGGAGSGGAGGAGGGAAGGAAGAGGAAVSPTPPPTTPTSPSVVNPSNPNTVPQQSYAPSTPSRSTTPSTPSTAAGGVASSSPDEQQPSTTAQSERTSLPKRRRVHHHRRHFAGPTWPYYCGSSPCVRINLPALYAYAANGIVRLRPVYTPSTLWWPGFYDYPPGQFGRGRPRYGGYRRAAGDHAD